MIVSSFEILCILLLIAVAWGCAAGHEGASPAEPVAPPGPKLAVSSAAIPDGGTIPEANSAYGANTSPPLAWSGAPPATKSFAVILEDPDAPNPKPFVHWVL